MRVSDSGYACLTGEVLTHRCAAGTASSPHLDMRQVVKYLDRAAPQDQATSWVGKKRREREREIRKIQRRDGEGQERREGSGERRDTIEERRDRGEGEGEGRKE